MKNNDFKTLVAFLFIMFSAFVANAQTPAIPTMPIITNNCGNTVLTKRAAPSGVTYYWQGYSSGTSTSSTYAATSVTRTSGTYYYLRARNDSTNEWSTSLKVYYILNKIPATPYSFYVDITYNNGSTTLTSTQSSSGITFYWQSSSTGTSTANSSSSITRTSGTVYYLRARNNTSGCWSSATAINYTIKEIPPIPMMPTVTKNCGNTVLTRGNPPSGVTWYWQSRSTGTSTYNNSGSTITRTSGTSYYLRARRNSTGDWGTALKVNYTVNTLPRTPSIQYTVIYNNGSTTLTRYNPPSGVTWYWQSSSTGTSTSNSSTSITRTSGTVYYLRGRNNISGCWGTSVSKTYTIKEIPPIPTMPTITKNCGNTVLTRGTPPSGVTWYWQGYSSETSTYNNSGSTITRTSGTYHYLRARTNSTGDWGTALKVNYTINTLPETPSTPTITNNSGSTTLTRSNPPSGITWYWQSSSAGTSTSNSNTSITLTSGTVYYLRARNNTTGCWGPAKSKTYTIKEIPSIPTMPTITNNCGNTVLTKKTPPSGVTYYWQYSSTGTSISSTYAATSVTRTSGTYYYLRARTNSTGDWGPVLKVDYTINTLPGTPSTPTVTNNSGSTTLTRSTPPSGITWYWQSSSAGTSTSNSNTSITLTSGTVYYLRARNNTTGCWGTARSKTYTIQHIPEIPLAPTITNNCGNTVLTKGTPPSNASWYWQRSSTGISTSGTYAASSITRTSGTVYYLRAKSNFSGSWSTARTVNYTINAAPAIPSSPTVTNNSGSTILTRSNPPSGITWYWQSSLAGTSTANSNVSITLTSGTVYYLRARNNTTGCWGSSRPINYPVNSTIDTPLAPTITNNCGSTILTKGTSPSGVTWYWQSTSTGTSTSNSSNSITLTSGTIYYLRAKSDSSSSWSSARSISYVINALPGIPSTPSVTNNCGSTTLTRGTSPSGVTWYWQTSPSGISTANSNSTVNLTNGTNYYLKARNNTSGCWSTARIVNYTINSIPSLANGNNASRNGAGTVTLTATPGANGNLIQWYSTNSSTTVLHTGTSYTTPVLGNSVTYYAASYNSTTGCKATDRKAITATIIISTQLWYADTDGDTYGNPNSSVNSTSKPVGYVGNNSDYDDTTANITNIQPQYFYKDIDNDGFGDPNDSVYYSVKPSGYVANNTDNCPNEKGNVNGCDVYSAPTLSNENYVYTRTYQKAMTTDAGITKNSDITESITYFDGLGKALQQIAIAQSPNFKDIIVTSNYDALGRVAKEFLPIETSNGATGSYRTEDLVLATKNFYKDKYPNDFLGITDVNEINPYTQKDFENSPLNRVTKMAAPGKDWKLGSGHEIKLNYLTNEATDVKIYTVQLDADRAPTLSGGTNYYSAGQLYKSVTKDENWKASDGNNFTTVEFKDKQGMVLLKRIYNANIPHDTYYVYDSYGNLTYVLPPKAEPQTAIPNATTLSELCYQYKYDHWNRLVEKKLPAKQKECIIYDSHDRPILTQDGSLRAENLWAFSKFDVYGRNIYAGLYANAGERSVIQQEVDTFILNNNKNNTEERSSSVVLIGQVNINYNNTAFPTTGITEVLTVNYYDDYNFTDADKPTLPTTVLGATVTQRTNGLQTASWVKTLDQNSWAKNYIVYDDKGREIKIIAKNYLGGNSIVESKLDFSGKVDKTVTSHKKLSTDTPITITDNFEYDHTGRLLNNTQQINSQPVEVIASNTYDNLGIHIQKNVGGTAINPLQKIDYAYNIKGSLTQINDVNSALNTADDNDLFAYKINYNNAIEGTVSSAPQFNGNISQTIWRTVNTDEKQSYAYNFDHLNRISNGLYSSGSALNNDTDKFKLSGITYDKNGNIKTLSRTGDIGQIDNLTYNYTNASGAETNQLVDVADATNNAEGYNDAVAGSSNYVYDSNGRLISDANKGITSIEYNYLDLPKKVTFTNGNSVQIVYNAAGNKLEKLYVTANGNTKTLYIDGFQYQDNQLQFFGQSEGYAYNDNGTYKNAYIYADHLGNNRLSYSDTNNDGTIDSNEIFSQSNYYPFGLTHKGELIADIGSTYNYKYQGKELQLENGLQQYDFGSRMYDPAIGRWMVLDPQAEQFFPLSPYLAMGNNPIMMVDPDGEFVFITAFLVAAAISMAVDYGIQVAMNHMNGKRGKDAWFNDVDFFDVGTSGLIGGLTGGFGAALSKGMQVGKFGMFLLNNKTLVSAASTVATSAVDITGEGVQEVTFDQFGQRVVTSLAVQGIATGIGKQFKSNSSVNKSEIGEGLTEKLSNEEIVQNAAKYAEETVPFTKNHMVTGTHKHTAASKYLKEFQLKYGNRGLETNFYFKNELKGTKGFLDVIDTKNGVIYDFKFGNPMMKASQYNKYFDYFKLPINLVDRSGNIIKPF